MWSIRETTNYVKMIFYQINGLLVLIGLKATVSNVLNEPSVLIGTIED